MAAINKRKLLESAQKNLQKGALDKALKDYQELLAADPRDANVRLKVGDLQLKRGNADDAITAYLKVADQFMRDGFDAKAVAIYKQVTKIDGKRFDVYIPLADLYQRLGLTNDAMAALQTAAESYQRDGRRREALDLLRRMASLDPTNTTSRLKVAELLHQEELTQEAVAEFEEAAAELDRQGDWEARAGVLQRLLEIAPDRAETYDALIALWLGRKQPGRAEPLARKLVALDPARAESQETLAGVLEARGHREGAIEAYRAAADAWRARGEDERARAIVQRHVPSEIFDAAGGTPNGAITNPIAESPFGEEGIGGEPPPAPDEFRFVDDGEPAPLAGGDDDFELELDDAPAGAVAEADVATEAKHEAPAPAPAPAERAPTAPAPGPVAASAPAEGLGAADVEQLLAEAAVYLRYGKHERALASLEGALAQEPQHLGALEQLGEAHLRGENAAEAVAIWTRAHGIAVEAGDTDRASSLRARIEAVDPAAAPPADAPPADAPPARAAAATVLFDTPAPPASDDVELDEIEIDVDEPELGAADETSADGTTTDAADEPTADGTTDAADEPTADGTTDAADEPIADGAAAAADEPIAGDETPPAAAASDPHEDSISAAGFEIEIGTPDVGAAASADADAASAAAEAEADEEPAVPDHFELAEEREAGVEAGLAGDTAEQREADASEATQDGVATEAATDAAPAAAAPGPARASGAELSSSTSQQIVEDLEEASFYFEQGLLDEAAAIYQRVIERAPNHPAALLRLGEIAAARGEDPSRAAGETAAAPAAAAEADESDAGATIDPPDDLDLTAREFGPEREWDDADDTTGDAVVAAADASGTPLDATDPGDWTTPDTTEPAPPLADAGEDEVVPAEAPAPTPDEVAAEAAADVAAPSEPEPAAADEPPPLELTAPEIRSEEDGAPAFDLAAELSEALRDEPAAPTQGGATDEDGFAALFREFKRGVSRTLEEGDVETHFDLGIAYREMGLLDDAIGEFRYALGSNARRLDALHMMGLCALDVGRPADAVGHLEQALASPEVPSDREAPLRYDLARAYAAHGDRERALDAFARVVELDAGFQDAAERLAQLRSGAPPDEVAAAQPEAEAYESFDDLLAQTADDAAEPAEPEAAAEEPYESFEEFAAEADAGDDGATAEAETEAGDAGSIEAEAEAEPEAAPALEPASEVVVEAEPVTVAEPAVAPAAEAAEPEPARTDEPPRRRRKISFF